MKRRPKQRITPSLKTRRVNPDHFVLMTHVEAFGLLAVYAFAVAYVVAVPAFGPVLATRSFAASSQTLARFAWSEPFTVLGLLTALAIAFQVTAHGQRSVRSHQLALEDRRVWVLTQLSACMGAVTVLGSLLSAGMGRATLLTWGDRSAVAAVGIVIAFIFVDASRVSGRLTWLRRAAALERKHQRLADQRVLLQSQLPPSGKLVQQIAIPLTFGLGVAWTTISIQAGPESVLSISLFLGTCLVASGLLAVVTCGVALLSVEMRTYGVVVGLLGGLGTAALLVAILVPLARDTAAAIPAFWVTVVALLLLGPTAGVFSLLGMTARNPYLARVGAPGLLRLGAARILSLRGKFAEDRLRTIRASVPR